MAELLQAVLLLAQGMRRRALLQAFSAQTPAPLRQAQSGIDGLFQATAQVKQSRLLARQTQLGVLLFQAVMQLLQALTAAREGIQPRAAGLRSYFARRLLPQIGVQHPHLLFLLLNIVAHQRDGSFVRRVRRQLQDFPLLLQQQGIAAQ